MGLALPGLKPAVDLDPGGDVSPDATPRVANDGFARALREIARPQAHENAFARALRAMNEPPPSQAAWGQAPWGDAPGDGPRPPSTGHVQFPARGADGPRPPSTGHVQFQPRGADGPRPPSGGQVRPAPPAGCPDAILIVADIPPATRRGVGLRRAP